VMPAETLTIERITLHQVELPLRRPFEASFGTIRARTSLLLKVEADGLAGWSEAAHLPLPVNLPEFMSGGKALLIEHILPNSVGRSFAHPGEIAGWFAGLKGNEVSRAAVEMAAWDLYAKICGLPLCRCLGASRNTAEVGTSIGAKDPERLLDAVAAAVGAGYKRVKVKIAPGADRRLLEGIRRKYPELPLMADANAAYSLADVEVFREMDALRLMMIEQPLAADDLIDHARLQRQISTPICLDESIRSAHGARKAAEAGSCRIMNIKPARVGGLAEALEVLEICRIHRMGAWVGGMLESAVGRAALQHFAAADGVTLPSDITASDTYLAGDVADGFAPVDGVLTLPDAPGLGITVDPGRLKEFTRFQASFPP
jgi:O-succinylbenzoate synthase